MRDVGNVGLNVIDSIMICPKRYRPVGSDEVKVLCGSNRAVTQGEERSEYRGGGEIGMRGVEHVCISVSDLERSIEFYTKLGFKILRRTTRPHAIMYLGRDILEIMPRLEEDKRNGFSPPFPYHLAFYTDDLEEDVSRLNDYGIETSPVFTMSRSEMESSNLRITEYADPEPSDPKLLGCMIPSEDEEKPWRAVRFKDPDGITLEIWQRR